jgi:hypothetical protein
MFIVAKAGVLCVCKHWQMWSIRSISNASVGIPWIRSDSVGKAAFMLMREVSVSPDMVILGRGGGGGGGGIILLIRR